MPPPVSLLDNTPWWLPGVTLAGAGTSGLLVVRCNPFGFEDEQGGGLPRGLEGGFYGPEHLGPHMWHCQARADARYRSRCRCGHRGRPAWLCNGHAAQFRGRMSGVCPPCVHPPAEIAIQHRMADLQQRAAYMLTTAEQNTVLGQLWDLQAELDELVAQGIVHRCPVRLEEVS
jgi:hypothetical protein